MDFLTVTITTLSPVVLTAMNNARVMTESRDFISGTVLRGVLASRYIESKKLDKKAHENEDFRKLFFGGLRFIDASPVFEGKRAMVLPLSLQRAKVPVIVEENEESLLDILTDAPQAGYKTLGGYGIVEKNVIQRISVEKQIRLHMSRASDRERLSGSGRDGGIYNYEAVAAGQTFQGIIVGDRNVLGLLIEGIASKGKAFTCYIGRSKYTEYGHCQLSLGEIQPMKHVKMQGKELYVRLETPWLPFMDTVFSADDLLYPFIETVKKALKSDDICIEKVIAKTEIIANFVNIWGLKRAEKKALAAGSVFKIKKESKWTENEICVLEDLMYQGQGGRIEEGFGQLRFWNVEKPVLKDTPKAIIARHGIHSEIVKELASKILMRRILARVRLQAEKDVRQLNWESDNALHTFVRLESMLGKRKDLENAKRRFQDRLKNDLRTGSVMKNHLENLKYHGQELKDILLGKDSGMPFAFLRFDDDVPVELANDVGFTVSAADNGEIFYEYWLWFFRHGRKLFVSRKGDK